MNAPDLLVLGGNPGGCVAAITAARAGLSVVLLEASGTLGGHNANGVFAFDTGDPATLGPVAREFAELVRKHYETLGAHDPVRSQRQDPVWESSVAAKIWATLCDTTPNLTVELRAVPVAAKRDGRRVVAVSWEPAATAAGDLAGHPADRHEVTPRLIIDATYEGDLLEWAGIPHRLGREPRSDAEPHAGRIYTSDRQPGPHGILPHSVLPGSTGDGDDKVMAFAARLHCRWYDDPSPNAPHRIDKPSAGYLPHRYRWEPRERTADGTPVWFTGIELLVGNKVLLSRTVSGNDVAGPGSDYIRADPRDRHKFRQAIVDHALDFLYFVQNDGGCPTLGLAEEFGDHENIPYRVYVREGRRLDGLVTLTETDLSPFLGGDGIRPAAQAHSVAIGDWAVESRAVTDILEPGHTWPEGWFFDRFSRAPHQIPYECLLSPDVDNVAFCGPLSATHLAFSAIRVEATRMNTAAAAGVAATLATGHRQFAGVDVGKLQCRLITGGSALTFYHDVPPDHPQFTSIQWAALRGWVPPDEQWRFLPSQPVTWQEFAVVAAAMLPVPRSVTGTHFRRITRRHPAFLAFESLYDLGTRAGIELFDRSTPDNAISRLLAPEPPRAEIDLDPAQFISVERMSTLLKRLALALGIDSSLEELRGSFHEETCRRVDLAVALNTIGRGRHLSDRDISVRLHSRSNH